MVWLGGSINIARLSMRTTSTVLGSNPHISHNWAGGGIPDTIRLAFQDTPPTLPILALSLSARFLPSIVMRIVDGVALT